MISEYYNKNNQEKAINLYFNLKKGDKLKNIFSNEIIEVSENSPIITNQDKLLILNNCFFERNRRIKIKTKYGNSILFSFNHYIQYEKL